MSVSTFFGSQLLLYSKPSSSLLNSNFKTTNPIEKTVSNGGLMKIECSSRPQKKATKHHMKTRPKKTQPWDVKRKPTVYPPLPPLPPDWTLVSSAGEDVGDGGGGGGGEVDLGSEAPVLEASIVTSSD